MQGKGEPCPFPLIREYTGVVVQFAVAPTFSSATHRVHGYYARREPMPKVMMTIHASSGPPRLEEIRRRYELKPDEIDEEFGVVEIDPERHDYTILVELEAARKVSPTENWDVSGPYSNPRIEPFGPPQA